MAKNVLIVAWFLVGTVAFFGAYLGVALPSAVLQALYSAFLVVGIVGLLLRLLSASPWRRAGGGGESHVD